MTVVKGNVAQENKRCKKKSIEKVTQKEVQKVKPVMPTLFATSVYDKCKQIPRGRVSTYKDIACALNNPNACRAVGSALKRNPYAPIVPCHRVVASDRTVGGFFGSTDKSGSLLKKKKDMLEEETVTFDESGKVSQACLHTFV
jgi:methylated-DNA-[protein]-cysteine S-methyltransferase